MHPLLENFSIFNMSKILSNNDKPVELFADLGLLPSRESIGPPCPKCGKPTSVVSTLNVKLCWRWVCTQKQKTHGRCCGSVNPLINTFLEGVNIPFRDVMAIVMAFVMNWPVNFLHQQMLAWRNDRGEPGIAVQTIIDYNNIFKEVAEVYATHNSHHLGGLHKTIILDEGFVTKRKQKRKKPSSLNQADTMALGIVCKEDKDGIYFKVSSKRKRNLLPFLKQRCHPESKLIITDSISKKSDENRNKVKTNNHSTYKQWYDNMALRYYRRIRLKPLKSDGERVEQFLRDMSVVYPGYERKKLELLALDSPDSAIVNFYNIIAQKSSTINHVVSLHAEESQETSDSSSSDSDDQNSSYESDAKNHIPEESQETTDSSSDSNDQDSSQESPAKYDIQFPVEDTQDSSTSDASSSYYSLAKGNQMSSADQDSEGTLDSSNDSMDLDLPHNFLPIKDEVPLSPVKKNGDISDSFSWNSISLPNLSLESSEIKQEVRSSPVEVSQNSSDSFPSNCVILSLPHKSSAVKHEAPLSSSPV